MVNINTRTVRASVIGQRLMKVFGRKRGKKLIKSLTHALKHNNFLPCLDETDVSWFFVWTNSSQGHEFWNNINDTLEASE